MLLRDYSISARTVSFVCAMCVTGGVKIFVSTGSQFIEFFFVIFGSPRKQFLLQTKKKGRARGSKRSFFSTRRFERGGGGCFEKGGGGCF